MCGCLQSQNLKNKHNPKFSNQQFNEESGRQRGLWNFQVTARAGELQAGTPIK
jgi:hypothetical protein